MVSAASVILILALASPAATTPATSLASVRRLSADLSKRQHSDDEGERVAASAELAMLTEAVMEDRTDGADARRRARLAERDALAYTLLSLGYSAKETADVVSERVTKRVLDTAHAMRLAGQRDAAAEYLNRHSRAVTIAVAAPAAAPLPTLRPAPLAAMPTAARPARIALPPSKPRPVVAAVSPEPVEAAIVKYARQHGVDAALIRAIIGAESAYVSGARSSAGAIGLMQLMPATARALGVNPHIANENIEGGVRYLAELIKMFGGVELALVAYNAGPGFAERYAKGQISLYGETRDYVQQVMARLGR